MADPGTRNQPHYDLDSPGLFPDHLTEVSDHFAPIASFGSGPASDREDRDEDDVWNGLVWRDTDTGAIWIHDGAGWVRWPGFTTSYTYERGHADSWSDTDFTSMMGVTFANVHAGLWRIDIGLYAIADTAGLGNLSVDVNTVHQGSDPPADFAVANMRFLFPMTLFYRQDVSGPLAVGVQMQAVQTGTKTVASNSFITAQFVGF